jgi:predicted metal-dependent phosphoesterase TrpH
MPGPDLHLHSTASDGLLSPAELVTEAARLGLPAIALTDHDTVSGVSDAIEAASATGVAVIPAVELSSGIADRDIHILGYHIDHRDPALHARLSDLRAVRVERAERIVSALARDGYSITKAEVMAAAGGGALGRAHIARVLVHAGHVATVDEAFRTLLGSSAAYYVPKPVADPKEVIGWIREAGGIAVLAHPGLAGVDDLLRDLVDAGLVGLEAYHSSHDAAARDRYEHLARSFGLVATGGSDFHGPGHEGADIGAADVPVSVIEALAVAHAQWAQQP